MRAESGLVGMHLTTKLLEGCAHVLTIINKNHDVIEGVEMIYFDGAYGVLDAKLDGKKIDVIFHLATRFITNHKSTDLCGLIDANVKFGTFLLEVSSKLEVKYFINTSTYAQYFDHQDYNPQNLYAATKESFEAILKYYEEVNKSTEYLTLELTDTYGPNDSRKKFINLVLDAAEKGGEFKMSPGDQEINYIFIDDVVNAYLTSITLLKKGIVKSGSRYSVFSDQVFKLKDLVNHIFDVLQVKIQVNRGFYQYRNREIMKFMPTYSKLPGWEPKFLIEDGIKMMLKL